MILNRRTLLASIGLALPVVGAQAATSLKKKPVHVTKATSHKVTKPAPTKISAVKSHRPAKPHLPAQS